MSTKEKERQGLLEHALSKDKFLRVESAPGGEPCSLPPTVQPSSHREGHVADRGGGARPASRSAGVPTSTADPLPAALGQSLPQRPALLQAPLTLLLEGELAVDRPRHHVAATVLGVRQRLRSAARSFHDLRPSRRRRTRREMVEQGRRRNSEEEAAGRGDRGSAASRPHLLQRVLGSVHLSKPPWALGAAAPRRAPPAEGAPEDFLPGSLHLLPVAPKL